MLQVIQKKVHDFFKAVALESYGWKSRKSLYTNASTVQWQDPFTLLWYSENTALRILKVQAMDEFNKR